MEPQEYDEIEYLRDEVFIEEERRIKMEAEWQEMEYNNKQLPARIIVLTEIKKEEEIENG